MSDNKNILDEDGVTSKKTYVVGQSKKEVDAEWVYVTRMVNGKLVSKMELVELTNEKKKRIDVFFNEEEKQVL